MAFCSRMIVLKDPGEDGNPPGERPNLDERFDMDDGMPEQWRAVVGYEGRYEVSDHGNARSVTRRIPVRGRPGVDEYYRLQRGKKLQPLLTNGTHLYVTLCGGRRGVAKTRHIAQLVLEACVGPRPQQNWHACHNDGNPRNNHLSNLRWDTPAANAEDTVRHGKHHEANKTHCTQGHEYTAENTGSNQGKRRCRRCHSARESARGRAKNAQREHAFMQGAGLPNPGGSRQRMRLTERMVIGIGER